MSSHKYLSSALNIWILLNVSVCFGFYLPGLAPVNYCRESESSPQCKVSVSNQSKRERNIKTVHYICFFMVK